MYAITQKFRGTFERAVDRTVEELKKEGFGVLTDIDVRATLREKLGLEVRPYRILGACNPPLAHRALEAEPDIGLLLPCNVVVREEADGSVTVAFLEVKEVLGLVGREDLAPLADEVGARLERVRRALA